MTQLNNAEFNQTASTAASEKSNQNTKPARKQNCDILLNNFQIKKKRCRVLLNYDHIVWERLDAKSYGTVEKKDLESLSNESSQYGSTSHIIHINEIIRVSKGATKSASLQVDNPVQTISPQQESNISSSNHYSIPLPTVVIPTEQYLTVHYAERINKSANDCNRWRVQTLTLYNGDAYLVQQWHAQLNERLNNTSYARVRRLLVFINPYGGRKEGLHVYDHYCKPLFQLAGIDASCIISQRANQIRDILMSHDLSPYDAVCCVGGDGTVAEVLNGLIFRTIRDLGMDPRRPDYIPKPCMPIGIIPAGSTDTVAYSLHGTADQRTAAIHMILGQKRGLDICSVQNREGILKFCASVLSYGYLGDVAAKSEKYRWMGTKRYEYTGVKAFFKNRGYEAEMKILKSNYDEIPIDPNSNENSTSSSDSICQVNCAQCYSAASSEVIDSKMAVTVCETDDDNNAICDELPSTSSMSRSADNINKFDQVDNFRNINRTDCDKSLLENQIQKDKQIKELLQVEGKEKSCDTQSNITKSDKSIETNRVEDNKIANSSSTILNTESGSRDTLNSAQNEEDWKVIKGKFFMISGANITCACSRSPNGISRFNHLGDGHLNLILVRKTSLLNNVKFVVNTMGKNGDIRRLPFVEIYRTKKFSFRNHRSDNSAEDYSIRGSCQPIADSLSNNDAYDSNVSSWNCDGEVVTDLDITMTSHCQLIDVFMRGPHTYTKSLSKDKANFCTSCCSGTLVN